jgi:rubrerythrin
MDQARVGGEVKDADFIEFVVAGEAAKGEFRCSECGYGVAVWKALPRCPMCGGEAWERSDWSPFTRAFELL